jgi:hypothetical protein
MRNRGGAAARPNGDKSSRHRKAASLQGYQVSTAPTAKVVRMYEVRVYEACEVRRMLLGQWVGASMG